MNQKIKKVKKRLFRTGIYEIQSLLNKENTLKENKDELTNVSTAEIDRSQIIEEVKKMSPNRLAILLQLIKNW